MSATTSKGITYPTSGDNIAPLETHFANLAQSADSAIPVVGNKQFTGPAAAAGTVDVSVTFATAFSATPKVLVSVQGSNGMSPYVVYIKTVSTTGFVAQVYRIAGSVADTNLYLNWMAK